MNLTKAAIAILKSLKMVAVMLRLLIRLELVSILRHVTRQL